MARPLRIEYPGAVYHLTSRGNARDAIFLDEGDYTEFLKVLCLVANRYNWIVHAYCLMTNHYHLLIETPEGNLSIGMRQLNGIYTQRFNRRHNHVGHIFQGRYKAILVDKDSYLLELCRYIVLNPVRVGMVRRPEEWQWSSYKGTIGKSKDTTCLTIDWILIQFGKNRKVALEQYKEFVKLGIKQASPLKEVKGQLYLGGESFYEELSHLLTEKADLKEIPRTQRYVTRPSLVHLFQGFKEQEKEKGVYEAHVLYGYTLKEIAGHLKVHYSTVGRIIKRIEE